MCVRGMTRPGVVSSQIWSMLEAEGWCFKEPIAETPTGSTRKPKKAQRWRVVPPPGSDARCRCPDGFDSLAACMAWARGTSEWAQCKAELDSASDSSSSDDSDSDASGGRGGETDAALEAQWGETSERRQLKPRGRARYPSAVPRRERRSCGLLDLPPRAAALLWGFSSARACGSLGACHRVLRLLLRRRWAEQPTFPLHPLTDQEGGQGWAWGVGVDVFVAVRAPRRCAECWRSARAPFCPLLSAHTMRGRGQAVR